MLAILRSSLSLKEKQITLGKGYASPYYLLLLKVDKVDEYLTAGKKVVGIRSRRRK